MALRKYKKSDEEAMELLNSMKYHQSSNMTNRMFIREHVGEPPVIGHVSPIGGPKYGGTNITVHGINFGFGSRYKCKFGSKVVSATFSNVTGTVHCISPALATAQRREEVEFRVAVFTNALDKTHQSATHYRKFTYYGTSIHPFFHLSRAFTPPLMFVQIPKQRNLLL